MKIDFVSDVVCPWCAVGLASLRVALKRLDPAVPVELNFEPFELNPGMGPEGEDFTEHLSAKYGISAEQIARNREALVARGAALGFRFGRRDRTWNTFDAHRLLHWAGLEDKQLALKTALLEAYHGDAENVGDLDVLVRIAASAGLDAVRARQVLASGDYAAAVRERERFYRAQGIDSVPAVIIDERYLISGGQLPEAFEAAFRQALEVSKASSP